MEDALGKPGDGGPKSALIGLAELPVKSWQLVEAPEASALHLLAELGGLDDVAKNPEFRVTGRVHAFLLGAKSCI